MRPQRASTNVPYGSSPTDAWRKRTFQRRPRHRAHEITTIFLIQDTSEFSFQRPETSAICMTQSVHSSRDKVGGSYCLT